MGDPLSPLYALVVTDGAGAAKAAFPDVYGLKLTRRINGACQLEFNAPTDDIKSHELLMSSRAVKLYRDGALVFYGVLGEPFSEGPDSLQAVAYDPFGGLGGAYIGDDTLAPVVYSSTDAGAIAWDLIDSLGYETHLSEGSIDTSVDRDRTYDAGKGVAEAITQLAEVEDGFFFRIDPVDGSGATFATFNVLYPDAGTDRPKVLFQYGEGTIGNVAEDGLAINRFVPVNRVVAVGATPDEGGAPPVATAEDATSQSTYGVFPKWLEFPDVVEVDTLTQHAEEALLVHPPVTVSFNALEGAPALFDDFDVGDTVYVRINNGRTLVSGAVRVNQVTLEVDDDTGTERLTGVIVESSTLSAQEVL